MTRRRFEVSRFVSSEEGGITVLSLYMFLAMLVVGGLAVDYGSGVASKTELQVAADAAAHAALYTRELNTADVAKAKAIQIAAAALPPGKYGTVLKPEDIVFGTWDGAAFTPDAGSDRAVAVTTRRSVADGNGVMTYMLGLVGYDAWDVVSTSVFETYYSDCEDEGIVSRLRLEMQSNGWFSNGICLHSQDYVKVSSNNLYDPGVIVSMPDKRNLELPSSGFTSNVGLKEALRDSSYQIRVLNRIDTIIKSVNAPNDPVVGIMTPSTPPSEYYRSYITSPTQITIKANGPTGLDPTKFKTGRIHYMDCKNDNTHKQIGSGFNLVKMVIITDCRLQIASGAVIQDAVIITTNPDAKSIYASSDIVIGKNDHCVVGGDVQIVTKGGVEFAAKTSIYGSQILAAGDVSLTANADGFEGVSIVAGGKADVTSNGKFGFCDGQGMGNSYAARYFRLVH
ncbi:pilus assembly protein TadG-related protein [Defluviimonas sp. WL0024]|uniref:Pilus assembly protein TadG-related protein n=1 Tax=Albidovulum salinarum TaxID=2984153 RepID=A0ABT2X8K6_9RHOB|nr:pilus assembly protein TadG-related protein [Defluviimonas sp. WL0024]MCU9850281.1 pilus assembly protein TadG-related protein [Defluviimonas sp. WL0024]